MFRAIPECNRICALSDRMRQYRLHQEALKKIEKNKSSFAVQEPNYMKRKTLHGKYQKEEAARITHENKKITDAIVSIQPTLDLVELYQFDLEHKKNVERLSSHPQEYGYILEPKKNESHLPPLKSDRTRKNNKNGVKESTKPTESTTKPTKPTESTTKPTKPTQESANVAQDKPAGKKKKDIGQIVSVIPGASNSDQNKSNNKLNNVISDTLGMKQEEGGPESLNDNENPEENIEAPNQVMNNLISNVANGSNKNDVANNQDKKEEAQDQEALQDIKKGANPLGNIVNNVASNQDKKEEPKQEAKNDESLQDIQKAGEAGIDALVNNVASNQNNELNESEKKDLADINASGAKGVSSLLSGITK